MSEERRSGSASDGGERRPGADGLLALAPGPLDLRSLALVGLFLLAAFYTLGFARSLLLPIVLAALFDFLLSPLVRGLNRRRVPTPVGAALVMVVVFGTLGWGLYRVGGPAKEWLEKAPSTFRRVEGKLEEIRRPVEEVTRAAERVEQMTGVRRGDDRPTVEIEEPSLAETVFTVTSELVAAVAVMLVLLYFLLASGDFLLRKLVRVLPRLEDKKRAVEIARRIEGDISRHLMTITVINVALGAAVAAAMHLLGMPNPLLWGLMATLLNFVPYLGAMVGVVLIGGAAFLTYDELPRILVAPATYFALTALEGSFITPVILGRRLALNPIAVFLGLFFWGWLWGIPGALLAVPMLVAFKIFCDRVEPLAPLGELLGR